MENQSADGEHNPEGKLAARHQQNHPFLPTEFASEINMQSRGSIDADVAQTMTVPLTLDWLNITFTYQGARWIIMYGNAPHEACSGAGHIIVTKTSATEWTFANVADGNGAFPACLRSPDYPAVADTIINAPLTIFVEEKL